MITKYLMSVTYSNTKFNSQFIYLSTNPAFCIKLDAVLLELDAPLGNRIWIKSKSQRVGKSKSNTEQRD
jgi:hypothetical protein